MRAETGGKVSVHRCDIRDGAAVDAMMDAIWREAPIDVLVNNAAATFIAQTEHLSFRAADAILAPTLHGTMYCTLAAGKRWIDGKHKGVVLSILSTSTITGRAFTVPSAMAKSAILAMTRSLAVEWGPKGIRTVAIAPGAFPTPGATGQLRPEGRDSKLGRAQSARPRRRASRARRSRKLPDLGRRRPTSMARWWCRTAARICAVPAPRICCNGPTRNGKQQRAARAQRLRRARAVANCLPKSAFPGYASRGRMRCRAIFQSQ